MMLLCVFSLTFISGCVGDFIYDSDTPYEEESKEKEWRENYGTIIYVKTNKKTYSVTVIDSSRNSDEKRVGINIIKVIEDEKKDNTDEWKIGSEDYPLPCITCLYE